MDELTAQLAAEVLLPACTRDARRATIARMARTPSEFLRLVGRLVGIDARDVAGRCGRSYVGRLEDLTARGDGLVLVDVEEQYFADEESDIPLFEHHDRVVVAIQDIDVMDTTPAVTYKRPNAKRKPS